MRLIFHWSSMFLSDNLFNVFGEGELALYEVSYSLLYPSQNDSKRDIYQTLCYVVDNDAIIYYNYQNNILYRIVLQGRRKDLINFQLKYNVSAMMQQQILNQAIRYIIEKGIKANDESTTTTYC